MMVAAAQPQSVSASSMTASVAQPAGRIPATAVTAARYDGYARTRFGMTEQAFTKVLPGKLQRQTQVTSGCYYAYPQWAEHGFHFNLGFMFVDGHFVRYDVAEAALIAPGGGRVGMSLAQIHALYGVHVVEGPRDYFNSGIPEEAKAKSLRVHAPAGAAVLLFETDVQGKVEDWRVGVPPAVDAMEGCS